MKNYKIPNEKVIVIGNNQFFNDDTEFEYSDLMFGRYRGISVGNNLRGIYQKKEDAIESANHNYKNNKPFFNGDIPFEIVFYHRGKGWCCMTSNRNATEYEMKDISKKSNGK